MSTGTNVYGCGECGGLTVTVHEVDGVTPFMLMCRAKGLNPLTNEPVCRGEARSWFYRVPDPLPIELAHLPVWTWYRPDARDPVMTIPGMIDHVSRGGLALRGPDEPGHRLRSS